MLETHRGFRLSLRDGRDWCITSDRYYTTWAAKLAAIMGLDVGAPDGVSKLVFCRIGNVSGPAGPMNDAGPSIFSVKGGNKPGWCSRDFPTTRIWYHDSVPDVLCEVKADIGNCIYANMWFSLQPIYHRSVSGGGLPFHAALVNLDGRGLLLCAPGETGKSTCCCRLPDYFVPLCDDEVLVVLDKGTGYWAHPFPTWGDYFQKRSEKTWNVECAVPLSGVFFLEQSEKDEAVPLGEGEAAILMTESAAHVCPFFWNGVGTEDERKLKGAFFNSASRIAQRIPAFRLRVSLNGRFWEEIERALK